MPQRWSSDGLCLGHIGHGLPLRWRWQCPRPRGPPGLCGWAAPYVGLRLGCTRLRVPQGRWGALHPGVMSPGPLTGSGVPCRAPRLHVCGTRGRGHGAPLGPLHFPHGLGGCLPEVMHTQAHGALPIREAAREVLQRWVCGRRLYESRQH